MLDAALELAAQGFAVFPCKPRSKEPSTFRGFYDATTNPAVIRRWFGNSQGYNVAVRTGVASRAWVLDIDDASSLAALLETHGPLPATRQSQSSRGQHFWFRCDTPMSCSASRIGEGIDIKGDGGYVAAPPSIHPSGALYRWQNDAPIVAAPAWLVALARTRPKAISERALESIPRPHNHRPPGAYGAAALKNEIDALAGTAPGSRNHALNRASFSLFQLVAGGELDGTEVERRLYEAAEANGLVREDGARQVRATIRSGASAGLQRPRSRGAR
jgi:putative DNA primase/helicase